MHTDERHMAREIKILSNRIARYMDNSSVKKQVDEVTGTNAWIIGYIGDHKDRDVFQKDFEKQFGITRSTASKVVNLMVQKGLVERKSVPSDARLKKLVLTEKSWEVYRLMRSGFAEMEETLQAGFSEEEIQQFLGYIHRMQENMEIKKDK